MEIEDLKHLRKCNWCGCVFHNLAVKKKGTPEGYNYICPSCGKNPEDEHGWGCIKIHR